MARISKTCPKCKKRQPVKLEFIPPPLEKPGTVVRWQVTCLVCGHAFAPDFDEVVADGVAWANERKAKFGSVIEKPQEV